jgi:type IV pilus assembly protein PilM
MAQRQKPIIGLDIDPAGVAVARVAVNGGLILEQAFTAQLEPGIVRDGEVIDVPALSDVLKEAWSAHKGLDRRVRIGVANQKVVVRTIELPVGAAGKELDAAVRFQAQDALPMPLDQAVLDWQTLAVMETENGPRQRILIAAARRDMIEPVLAAARGAGLRVEGIDLAAFAMIRALRDETADEADTLLYAELAGITNVAVAQGPQCLFARSSGSGVEGLAVELAERRGLTLEHSRAWLEHVGVDTPLEQVEGDAEIVADTRTVLLDGVRRIASEIRQSLDFHHMQSTGAPVARAIFTGPGLTIPGFADAVGAEIGLEVTHGIVGGDVAGVDSAEVTVAAGLASPGTPGVNLLPADERRAAGVSGRSGGLVYVALGVLALMLVLATSYVMATNNVKTQQAQVDAATRQADAAEQVASDLTAYADFSSLRQNRISTVRNLATTRYDWAHALGELSRVLPKNVWLTTLSGSVSSGGTGGAASGVRSSIAGPALTMTGCTTSHPMVATLMSELRRMDGVVRVSLDSSQKGSETDSSSSTGDCRGGSGKKPQFNMTIFLTAPTPTPVETAPTTDPASATGGGAPATGGTPQ